MKSIVVFNNKGGVGKTTLLCNVAGYLALKKKKKVLVIDADPQCNATQNLFPEAMIDTMYAGDSPAAFTIYKIIQPLAAGKGFSKDLEFKRSESFGVDVLPGDPKLALTEDLLSTDWTQAISGSTRGIRTTHVFGELLDRCQKYDFVLFDVGPSLGSLNRSVLLGCDYFLSPMSIDIFSLRAIENIAVAIAKWQKALENGLEQNEEPEELEDIPRIGWKLRYLGYVTQQYTAKKDSHGKKRAVRAYERILEKIPALVEREFINKMNHKSVRGLSYDLGGIPALHSIVPLSQTSRKPIFELRGTDGVVGAHFAKVAEYETIIAGIVNRLLKNAGSVK